MRHKCHVRAKRRFKFQAFSMVEMLVVIVIIAVVAAATVPVMTKKLKTGDINIGGGADCLAFNEDCENKYNLGSNCSICNTCDSVPVCMDCKADKLNCDGENQGINYDTCECMTCDEGDDGGDENCARCGIKSGKTVCSRCKEGYYINNEICTPCVTGRSDPYNSSKCMCAEHCRAGYCNANGSCQDGGCENGYIQNGGECLGSIDTTIVSKNGRSTLWTTRNAGDSGGAFISDDVAIYKISDGKCYKGNNHQQEVSISNCQGNNKPICWMGTTSETANQACTVGANSSNYSGCNRTLCNWHAANIICSDEINGNMSLPNMNQFQDLREVAGSNSAYTAPATNFCSDNSAANQNTSMCQTSLNCVGAPNNTCQPRDVWGDTASGGKHLNFGLYESGLVGPAYDADNSAISVRCVKELPAHCAAANNLGCTHCETPYHLNNDRTACELDVLTTNVNGVTWTTRNAGDEGGPAIPLDRVYIYNLNEPVEGHRCTLNGVFSANCGDNYPTCWQGTTGATTQNVPSQYVSQIEPYTCDSRSLTGYSGCNRTVCNWYAANIICEEAGMYLPNWADFKYAISIYGPYSGVLQNQQLDFCYYGEGAYNNNYYTYIQSSRCTTFGRARINDYESYSLPASCPGAGRYGSAECQPDKIWNGNEYSDGYRGAAKVSVENDGYNNLKVYLSVNSSLGSGVLYDQGTPFSVRCVQNHHQ